MPRPPKRSHGHAMASDDTQESQVKFRRVLADLGVGDPPASFLLALSRAVDADPFPLALTFHGTSSNAARSILGKGFREWCVRE